MCFNLGDVTSVSRTMIIIGDTNCEMLILGYLNLYVTYLLTTSFVSFCAFQICNLELYFDECFVNMGVPAVRSIKVPILLL